MFKKIAIIGVGLIGGSIGLAARKKKLAREIVGVCRHESSLKKALKLGAIDKATLSVEEAVSGADLIILATPVGSFKGLAKKIDKAAKLGAILIDVGSTKEDVVKSIQSGISKKIFYVGTHPMAGSEKSGVLSAKKDLFENSTCIVCRTNRSSKASLGKVKKFWQALGAKVVESSAKDHDREVAQISHLPHAIASALVGCTDKDSLRLASSGFKDTTRIASGEPGVWADIFISNRKEILNSILRFERDLKKIKALTNNNDWQGLNKEFKKNKDTRDKIYNNP